MLKVTSYSETETVGLGFELVHFLGPGDIVCLFGTLGAGKTILVKGLAKGLGISKDEVISPSFVLVREYHPVRKNKYRVPLYHLDLFRLKTPQDIFDLGYEEYIYAQGICVLEWAQRLGGFLPPEFLRIELEITGKMKRIIKFIANGQRYRKLLQKFISKRIG